MKFPSADFEGAGWSEVEKFASFNSWLSSRAVFCFRAKRCSQQFCVLINYAKMIFSAHRGRRRKRPRERKHLFPSILFLPHKSRDFPIYDLFAKQNNNKTIKLYDVPEWKARVVGRRAMRWLNWRLNSDKYIRIMFQFRFFLSLWLEKWNETFCHVIHHRMAIGFGAEWSGMKASSEASSTHVKHYALNA